MKGHELDSFTHSKTKRSTNSIIHNSRPTKKAHEIDSKFERNLLSSDFYTQYYPIMSQYSIGVSNPIFDRNKIHAKYQNHVLGIRQGVLFHEMNIFIFSPILQSDVVSNLMSAIYKEESCHSSIVQLPADGREKTKQLKKVVSSLAYKVMKMNSFDQLNCIKFLAQNVFFREKFTEDSTFDTLLERFETICVMVCHEMPMQRMNKPGKNCVWIKEMTKPEVRIIHDCRFSISTEKLGDYLKKLEDNKEKYIISLNSSKVTFLHDKNTQGPVCEVMVGTVMQGIERDKINNL